MVIHPAAPFPTFSGVLFLEQAVTYEYSKNKEKKSLLIFLIQVG